MTYRRLFPVVMVLLIAAPVFAQFEPEIFFDQPDNNADDFYIGVAEIDLDEKSAGRTEDFWISPGAEFALYSLSGGAYGGGFAIGYGRGTSIGIKVAYLVENEYKITTLEIDFLIRFYFQGSNSISGPFLQVIGGPVIFARDTRIEVPSEFGSFSLGACFGWRFLFSNRWFIEPAIRAGYPYGVGAGVSLGLRF